MRRAEWRKSGCGITERQYGVPRQLCGDGLLFHFGVGWRRLFGRDQCDCIYHFYLAPYESVAQRLNFPERGHRIFACLVLGFVSLLTCLDKAWNVTPSNRSKIASGHGMSGVCVTGALHGPREVDVLEFLIRLVDGLKIAAQLAYLRFEGFQVSVIECGNDNLITCDLGQTKSSV